MLENYAMHLTILAIFGSKFHLIFNPFHWKIFTPAQLNQLLQDVLLTWLLAITDAASTLSPLQLLMLTDRCEESINILLPWGWETQLGATEGLNYPVQSWHWEQGGCGLEIHHTARQWIERSVQGKRRKWTGGPQVNSWHWEIGFTNELIKHKSRRNKTLLTIIRDPVCS